MIKKELFLSDDTSLIVMSSGVADFFVVSSILVKNQKAFLVDTRFIKSSATEIADTLRKKKLDLSGIYISHGDPDFYFGLEEIKRFYPQAIATTTPDTAKYIVETVLGVLKEWKPRLKENAPQNIILPEVLEKDTIDFYGIEVKIFGSNRKKTTLYFPRFNLLLGGVNIFSGIHLFLADTQSKESRENWIRDLKELRSLDPKIVIPGHADIEKATFDASAIDFTIEYLQKTETALKDTHKSQDFIQKMSQYYPRLGGQEILELSAKVLTKEMPWG